MPHRFLRPPPQTSAPPTSARRALAAVRRAAAEIGPETIEKIAQRVAAILREEPFGAPHTAGPPAGPSPRLIDAGELARHLGVTRAWIYEHAHELGAIRISTGPRGRIRFDLQTARETLETTRTHESAPPPETTRPGRPRRHRPAGNVPLLPVHEPRGRGILSRFARAVGRDR
jgi:hypothetical protein